MAVSETGPGDATIDIIEGVRWQEEAGVVSNVQRMVIVTDLPGPIVGNADFNVRLALNHVSVPQPGEVHPSEPNVFVTSRAGKAISPTQINILVTYQVPGGGDFPPPDSNFVLSGGSSVEQVETSKFILTVPPNTPPYAIGGQVIGKNIEVKPPQSIVTEGDEGINKNQTATVAAFETRTTISINNTFTAPAPWAFAPMVTNAVNDGGWRYDGGFSAPRTWQVEGYSFELTDRTTVPPTYRQTVKFRHNPNTWDPEVFWVDPRTGRPPKDVGELTGGDVDGQSYYRVGVHIEMNFNQVFVL